MASVISKSEKITTKTATIKLPKALMRKYTNLFANTIFVWSRMRLDLSDIFLHQSIRAQARLWEEREHA